MPSQTYAEWLRQKVRAAGYDVDSAKGGRSALAEAADMSVTQVGRTLEGKTVPSIESQRGLCRALRARGQQVSLAEMLVRSGLATADDFPAGEPIPILDVPDAAEQWGIRAEDVSLLQVVVEELRRRNPKPPTGDPVPVAVDLLAKLAKHRARRPAE